MKKKYIIICTLIVFLTSIVFLFTSIIVLQNINDDNTEDKINAYLNIADSSFTGTNYEDESSLLLDADSNIVVTFVSNDGTLLFDSSDTEESDYLSLDEFSDLGKVVYRYSSDNERMAYLAEYSSSYSIYIRISIPQEAIKTSVYSLTIAACIIFIVVSSLSVLIIDKSSNSILKPLKDEIEKLSNISGNKVNYEVDDLETLSVQIDYVYQVLKDEVNIISNDKDRLNYIIENIQQGLIIIDSDKKLNLVNNVALSIFERTSDTDLLNKDYHNLIVNKDLGIQIEESIKYNSMKSFSIGINNVSYLFLVSSINDNFVTKDNKNGVSIFIVDDTKNKQLEKMKSDFFANASHELKSPLTSIIGYQEMIKEGIIESKEEIEDALSNTIREANRMNQIIIEMLELSKLEESKEKELSEVSLFDTVKTVVKDLDIYSKQKNISYFYDIDDFDVLIAQDDLYQLIKNLVDNAIKYNNESGSIYITIKKKTKRFIIRDTGIGVSKENQPRIFERFYRVDKAKSKEIGGTGLGLAIVKHICINNNIKINVNSSLGVGTEFILIFPSGK